VFEDYHLQVGEIIADTEVRKGPVLREQRLDETEIGQAKPPPISELWSTSNAEPASTDLAVDLGSPPLEVIDQEIFESIHNPGKQLLAGWRDAVAADRWEPNSVASCGLHHSRVRVIRDCGMADRREAPQYYPLVQPAGGSR
jgi:hypothetical protein